MAAANIFGGHSFGSALSQSLELPKLIRQPSPKSAIVFLTQNDDQDIRDAALAVGLATYLFKLNASTDL